MPACARLVRHVGSAKALCDTHRALVAATTADGAAGACGESSAARGAVDGVADDALEGAAPADYEIFCATCGEPADEILCLTTGITYGCSTCRRAWRRGERDHCARCEAPLGDDDTVCASCRAGLEGGSR